MSWPTSSNFLLIWGKSFRRNPNPPPDNSAQSSISIQFSSRAALSQYLSGSQVCAFKVTKALRGSGPRTHPDTSPVSSFGVCQLMVFLFRPGLSAKRCWLCPQSPILEFILFTFHGSNSADIVCGPASPLHFEFLLLPCPPPHSSLFLSLISPISVWTAGRALIRHPNPTHSD